MIKPKIEEVNKIESNSVNVQEEIMQLNALMKSEYTPITWKKRLIFFGYFKKFNEKRIQYNDGSETIRLTSIDIEGYLSSNPTSKVKLRISCNNYNFRKQLETLEINSTNKNNLFSISCIRIDNKGYPIFVVRVKLNGKWLTSNQFKPKIINPFE